MSRIIESFLSLSKEKKIALCAVGGAVVAYSLYKWNTTQNDQPIIYTETMNEDEATTEQEEEFDEYRKGNSNKVLTLGLPASGKSSLVARFIYDEASEEYEPTNGFNIKNLSINGKSVEIWESKLYTYIRLGEIDSFSFFLKA